MNVLVDTSAWSLSLRRRRRALGPVQRAIVFELRELIKQDRVVLIGPIRQEILTGVREPSPFDELCSYLREFQDEPLVADDYEEAARFHNQCRASGINGTPIDCLICAAASRRGLPILTNDTDFLRFESLLPISLYRPGDKEEAKDDSRNGEAD